MTFPVSNLDDNSVRDHLKVRLFFVLLKRPNTTDTRLDFIFKNFNFVICLKDVCHSKAHKYFTW